MTWNEFKKFVDANLSPEEQVTVEIAWIDVSYPTLETYQQPEISVSKQKFLTISN